MFGQPTATPAQSGTPPVRAGQIWLMASVIVHRSTPTGRGDIEVGRRARRASGLAFALEPPSGLEDCESGLYYCGMTFLRDPLDPDFFNLLKGSYLRIVGSPLVPERAGAPWLYHDAPFGVLAHSAEPEPRFIYANEYALKSFDYSWSDFIGLASKFSAEPDAQGDRQRLLAAVESDNFVSGYRGRRVARSGRKFWIEDVTMWNLIDEGGRGNGQAALFWDNLTDS